MSENRKPYRAVVVCLDPNDGILFAKRSNSVMETDHIIFDDILRIEGDCDCPVTIESQRDGFGECIFTSKYGSNELMYKVCFDDEEEDNA